MPTDIFELKNVYYSYKEGIHALSDVSMNVKSGQKIAVIGPNGTGKSTLLQLLDGLIFPASGAIKAFGVELRNESVFDDDDFLHFFRSKVGLVFQNPDVQLFCPTVKEDIAFGPLQMGMDKTKIKERLEQVSQLFNIRDLLERMPYQLSAGEKRKAAIASVLIMDPQVLLLDEPTAGLDPKTVRSIVDTLNNESLAGKTIITATHDLHILSEISDKAYVLNSDKKIIAEKAVQDLLNDEEFLQENNLLHIHAHHHNAGSCHLHPHSHCQPD